MYPVIFDANVWVKYARAKNIAPLLDRMISYQFLPIVNNYMLGEIFDVLLDNKWMIKQQATATRWEVCIGDNTVEYHITSSL